MLFNFFKFSFVSFSFFLYGIDIDLPHRNACLLTDLYAIDKMDVSALIQSYDSLHNQIYTLTTHIGKVNQNMLPKILWISRLTSVGVR